MSPHDTKNPTGGVSMGHVMESPDPNDDLQLFKELLGVYLLPDYGPVISVNRPVRTRLLGWCGGWGAKPPRLPD